MPQPPRPPRPPEVISGLDDLLKDPGPLHNVTITKAKTVDPTLIDIRANITDPQAGGEITLSFFWLRAKDGKPDRQRVKAGTYTSEIAHGRWWDRDRLDHFHPRTWHAVSDGLQELRSSYQRATYIQWAYLDKVELAVYAELDTTAQKLTRWDQDRAPRRSTGAIASRGAPSTEYPHYPLPQLSNFASSIHAAHGLHNLRITYLDHRDAGRLMNVTASFIDRKLGPREGTKLAAFWEVEPRNDNPYSRLRVGAKTALTSSADHDNPEMFDLAWLGLLGRDDPLYDKIREALLALMRVQDRGVQVVEESQSLANDCVVAHLNEIAQGRTRFKPGNGRRDLPWPSSPGTRY